MDVKEERGNRIFPVTDKSIDVLKCFTKRLKELKVNVEYNTRAEELIVSKVEGTNKLKIDGVRTNNGIIKADKVILATGGKSYPLTGSTGDGYILAKNVGHTITEIKPSLIPLETY